MDPGPLKKADPIPKFTVWVKDSFLTNLRVLISNMSIVFKNSSPKIPTSGIFGSKFKDFYFCPKFCGKTNSSTLISNMAIFFSNSIPKYPNKAFLVPNLGIFISPRNFAIRQIRECWFQIWQYFFSNSRITHFWSQI